VLVLDDAAAAVVLAEACAAEADAPGFGELTQLPGGDAVDGLLASLMQTRSGTESTRVASLVSREIVTYIRNTDST